MHHHRAVRVSILTILFLVPLGYLILWPGFAGHDWDWFFAHYESLRQSVVVFHQFPWWNPWTAGGMPLIADPQIGFPSPISLFVIAFGTVWGLKIAVLAHYAAGLWGMFFLLRYLRPHIHHQTAFLLSIIWAYSGFTVLHTLAGHISFLQYLLVPWCILALVHHRSHWWWLRATVVWSIYMLAGPHYIVIQSLIILAPFLVLECVRTPATHRRRYGLELALVAVGVVLIVAPRLYFSLSYLTEFPRHGLVQWGVSFSHLIQAFVLPDYLRSNAFRALGSWEVNAFMGMSFIVYGVFALVDELRQSQQRRSMNYTYWIFFFLGIACCLLALGAFSQASPYALLLRVPILSWMQVPSRWLGWAVFFFVVTAGVANMRKKILTLFLLVFAVVEVINVISVQPKPFRYSSSVETPSAPGAFEQYEQYPGPNPEPEKNSYVAIRHHFGEVRAYEPIFDLNIFRQTDRCGLNTGCPLLTGADLLSWSPNRLVLEGQPGALARLNMNNANGWMENEHRLAQTNRILDNQQGITVTIPPSGQVTLTYRPVGAWLMYGSLGLLLCYCLLAFVARRFNTLNNE